MRLLPFVLTAVAFTSSASATNGLQTIAGDGVQVRAPATWAAVESLGESARSDPHTVLVVGTTGVTPSYTSGCQIAAYRIPARGAAVVVVRWRTLTSGGGRPVIGRTPLAALTRVTRPSFECFQGRGAAAQLGLGSHAYQVNVMVGNEASSATVTRALAVARSFRLDR